MNLALLAGLVSGLLLAIVGIFVSTGMVAVGCVIAVACFPGLAIRYVEGRS